MDLWTDFEGQRYHVMGITISDPELIKRTKRVVVSCFCLVVISFILCSIDFTVTNKQNSSNKESNVIQSLISLVFSLVAPGCGYLGAKRGSASLMCMFVMLMCMNAFNAVVILLMINMLVSQPLPTSSPGGNPAITSWWNASTVLFTVVWVISLLLSVWAAYNGNRLFSKLSQGERIAESDDPELGLPQIDTQIEMANSSYINTPGFKQSRTPPEVVTEPSSKEDLFVIGNRKGSD